MLYLIHFLGDLLYVISVFYVCSSFRTARRITGWERTVEYLIDSGFLFLLFLSINDDMLTLILTWLVMGVGFYRRFRGQGLAFLRYGFMVILLHVLLTFNSNLLLQQFIGWEVLKTQNLQNAVLTMENTLLTFLFLAALLQLILKRYRTSLDSLTTRQQLFLTLVEFFDILIIFSESVRIADPEGMTGRHGVLFAILIPIGVFLQLWCLLSAFIMSNSWKERVELIGRLMQERENFYVNLGEREHETRKFRHDLKDHFLVMNQLYREGKGPEFEEYLRSMSEKVEAIDRRIRVNNPAADAIVQQYVREAEKQGIQMTVRGCFPENCPVEAFDLCTILGNLLSNALEAVRRCGGKKIRLEVRFDPDRLYLRLENDCPPELKVDGDRLPTSKEDHQSHGFGLENVRDCVEKYDGWMRMTAEKGSFHTYVELELPDEAQGEPGRESGQEEET